MAYNLEVLRDFLLNEFNSEDLLAFCQDYFAAVYRDFTDGESERMRVRLLIDYADQYESLDLLVAKLRETRPAKFPQYEARLRSADSANLSPSARDEGPSPRTAAKFTPLIVTGVGLMLLAVISLVVFVIKPGNDAAAQSASANANATGTQTALGKLDAEKGATAAVSATNGVLSLTRDAQGTIDAAGTAAVETAQAVQKTADAQRTMVAITATAVANATSTASAVAIAAAKYNGDWIKSNTSPAGVKELVISSIGPSVTLKATADYRDILTANGGWASQACATACAWGEATVAFKDDPLVVTLPIQSGLAHVLTFVLVDNQLAMADQTRINGVTRASSASIYSSSCSRLNCVIVMPLPSVICAIVRTC